MGHHGIGSSAGWQYEHSTVLSGALAVLSAAVPRWHHELSISVVRTEVEAAFRVPSSRKKIDEFFIRTSQETISLKKNSGKMKKGRRRRVSIETSLDILINLEARKDLLLTKKDLIGFLFERNGNNFSFNKNSGTLSYNIVKAYVIGINPLNGLQA